MNNCGFDVKIDMKGSCNGMFIEEITGKPGVERCRPGERFFQRLALQLRSEPAQRGKACQPEALVGQITPN